MRVICVFYTLTHTHTRIHTRTHCHKYVLQQLYSCIDIKAALPCMCMCICMCVCAFYVVAFKWVYLKC